MQVFKGKAVELIGRFAIASAVPCNQDVLLGSFVIVQPCILLIHPSMWVANSVADILVNVQ